MDNIDTQSIKHIDLKCGLYLLGVGRKKLFIGMNIGGERKAYEVVNFKYGDKSIYFIDKEVETKDGDVILFIGD